MRHSAPLGIPFPMASFIGDIEIFSFGPKTMDYSPWFRLIFFPFS